MPPESRNYWWLNANPSIWSYSDLAPGAENNYTQYNESGSLRQVPKYFLEVQPGDLVLGYATSPQKELVCLCEITRPLENGAFHFKKLFDFPNPVPSTAWTSDPLLSYFHFQGSLFKVSQEQWDGFIGLVTERNPGMTLPVTPSAADLEARLDAFLASFTPSPEILARRKQAEAARQAFVARFPLDTLSTLTPEQYCIGRGDKDNFCWWVERGTVGFGKYFPGTSRSYGLFYKKDENTIVSTKLAQRVWGRKPLGSDTEVLHRCVLEPLHRFVASHGQAPIPKVIGHGFSLKVLELYHPDEFIRINSTRWIEIIIGAFHLPYSGNYATDNQAIKALYDRKKAQFPDRDFEQMDFILFIRDMLKLANKDSRDDDTPSNPPEETPTTHPLNTILYGPPGTGKTHNIVNHVLSIIDAQSLPETQTPGQYAAAKARFDELTQQGRIAFVTFHQSYGYEDFIEGIRPNTDLLKETESGDIQYKIEEGIFRKFCARATENWESSRKSGEELSSGEQAKKCIADLLDEELSKDSTEARRRFQTLTGTAFFIESANETHIRIALPDNPSWRMVILSRAELMAVIASGRAFTGPKEIHDFLGKNAARAHDSYLFALYTELRPHMAAAHAEPAVVPELPFVFVIDEINRGNISKIFGELITLIEPTKRLGAAEATKAILPYSGDEFGVPPNVYILGTMNTADRSIALLDTALRRRFDFVEMMPKPDLLSNLKPDGIDLKQMLETINNRIEFLLDREHTIGHAYFLGDFAAHPTLEGLAAIFRKRIVPLLQEYFFEDYAKIRLVLGDASIKKNTPEFQFVREDNGQAQELFPGVPDDFGGPVNADRVLYRINDTAFDKAKSYIGIYT